MAARLALQENKALATLMPYVLRMWGCPRGVSGRRSWARRSQHISNKREEQALDKVIHAEEAQMVGNGGEFAGQQVGDGVSQSGVSDGQMLQLTLKVKLSAERQYLP